jgi:tetratricopeptide (TPR) repeat protein
MLGASSLALTGAWLAMDFPHRAIRTAYDRRDYSNSLRLAQDRLIRHPADATALLWAARASAGLGRWPEAEAYFAQAPVSDLEDLELRVRGLEIRKLWVEAVSVYERILHADPLNGNALQRLAVIRIQQDRDAEARVFAQRLAQVSSHRAVGLVMTALLDYGANNPAKTVESLEEAMRLSPNLEGVPTGRAQVLQLLAESLIQLGKADDAEPYAQEARRLSSSPDPCWLLGQVRQMRGDETGAQQFWEEAVARSPTFVPALRELGQLYLKRREPQKALPWFLRAKEVEPNNSAVLYSLDVTYRYLAQEKTASPSGADKSNHSPDGPLNR